MPTQPDLLRPETPLDPGIAQAVQVLVAAGVATYESGEGGL